MGISLIPTFENTKESPEDPFFSEEANEFLYLWDGRLRQTEADEHAVDQKEPSPASVARDLSKESKAKSGNSPESATAWDLNKTGAKSPPAVKSAIVKKAAVSNRRPGTGFGGRLVGDRRTGNDQGVDDGPELDGFPDLPDEKRSEQLQIIEQEVQNCQICPELVANRTRTVFGQGPVRPRLLFMGEAPGADEDRQGVPMVGVAGQLLNKIIGAMKMKREDVYVLNTIKCRPPINRNPLESECTSCRSFWRRQIEILKPDCIVCLGAVAAKTLLQTTMPVGRLRGKMHNYRSIPVMVTYHPAYLLRTASAKRQTWEDMQKVMALLGIPIK